MKKYTHYIVLITAVTFVAFVILLTINRNFKDWVKIEVFHSDYSSWKKRGGTPKQEYFKIFNYDTNRDSMIKGLTFEEIKRKFPFLIKGENYNNDSYKGNFMQNFAKDNPKVQFLWFQKADVWDWCIIVHEDPSKNRLEIIKG